jgi:hypothetical protein
LVADIEAHGGRAVACQLDARKEDEVAFLKAADAFAPLEGASSMSAQTLTTVSSIPLSACSVRCGRWRATRDSSPGGKLRA